MSGTSRSFPTQWIREMDHTIHARKLFRDGQKILIAVSGGVDSMVLLHALDELSGARDWKLAVAHFNHQLRGRDADADERLVGNTAKALKLPFVSGRGDVRDLAESKGISLEMAGRQLRHEFLARTALARKIPSIALAHHANDQVELFFLRVLRGTGGQGLGGMKWNGPSPADSAIRLVRPLLDQSKDAICEVAKSAGIEFSDDATNAQLDMERNRVRHVLIPFLRENFSKSLIETVPRLMELAGGEAEVVTDLARQWLSSQRRSKFSQLAVAVQRRVLHLQLIAMGHAPDFEMVERLRGGIGQPFALDVGRVILRDSDGILQKQKSEKVSFNPARKTVILEGNKGQERLEGFALSWKIERVRGEKFTAKPNVEYFDADKIGARICLRHWQAGDRFQPIGVTTPRKLQDLLTNAKIPRAERHCRIIAVTNDDEPFWVEGLRISEKFKLTPDTVRRLKWEWRRGFVSDVNVT